MSPSLRLLVAALAALSVASCGALGRAPEPIVALSDLSNLPFAGVDDAERPIGRDVEMMERLADELGRPLEWRRLPFERLLDAVVAGEGDVVCATLGITPERALRVDFSRPYYTTTISVVARAGAGEPTSLAELAGRTVYAGRGTTSERAAHLHLPDAVIAGPGEKTSARERLDAGEVDAIVVDGPDAARLVATPGAGYVLLGHLEQERYALALPREQRALRDALDAALEELEASGELAALNRRHGL